MSREVIMNTVELTGPDRCVVNVVVVDLESERVRESGAGSSCGGRVAGSCFSLGSVSTFIVGPAAGLWPPSSSFESDVGSGLVSSSIWGGSTAFDGLEGSCCSVDSVCSIDSGCVCD